MESTKFTLRPLETSFERTERTYIRLIVGGIAALVFFILACWAGFRAYNYWQEEHLVRRAAAYLSGGDLRTASLTVRRALQLNPDNAAANRLLATIAEKAGERSAVELRRKVFEANPASIDDGVSLVRTALRFSDLATAEKTLQQIGPLAEGDPQFHAASGRLAEMKNDLATAETHWARAVEIAPTESGYRYQLALVRLASSDPAKHDQGRAALEQLRGDASQRVAATRTLLVDSISRREEPQRARALAQDLDGYSEANFSDRVMHLEILRQLNDRELGPYLVHLKTEAAAKPADAAALLTWLLRKTTPREAVEYASSLPATVATQWPVPMVLAAARAESKDWPGLEQQTRTGDWGYNDFLRHAFLARALRGENQKLEADRELSFAERAAEANPRAMGSLLETVASWGWENDAVEMLWAMAKTPETKFSALRALYDHYVAAGDTSGLYRVLAKLSELNPHDVALQNNFAQVSLLIGIDVERATKVAAEASAKEPSNPAFASTYAFALLSKGDLPGALQVMGRLSGDQLREPATATYYGIILAAAGQKEKASQFLGRSAEANLMPEEKALVAKAEASLQ